MATLINVFPTKLLILSMVVIAEIISCKTMFRFCNVLLCSGLVSCSGLVPCSGLVGQILHQEVWCDMTSCDVMWRGVVWCDVTWHVYRLPFNCTKITILITFQFKPLHRQPASNDLLRKIGIKNDNMCSFCEAQLEN